MRKCLFSSDVFLPVPSSLLKLPNASDPPPPAPHNIFLRHKEHRVFKRRGETNIRISNTPEPVYYHPFRSCVPSASSMNIKLEESVVKRLSRPDSNKQLLWREFGVRLKEGRFSFAFLRQNLHIFLFLVGYFRRLFTENVLFKYLRCFNISYIFSRKSWKNHQHGSNKHGVRSFLTFLTVCVRRFAGIAMKFWKIHGTFRKLRRSHEQHSIVWFFGTALHAFC